MKEGAQGSSAMESPTSSTEAERKTILVCWARTRDLGTSRVVVPGLSIPHLNTAPVRRVARQLPRARTVHTRLVWGPLTGRARARPRYGCSGTGDSECGHDDGDIVTMCDAAHLAGPQHPGGEALADVAQPGRGEVGHQPPPVRSRGRGAHGATIYTSTLYLLYTAGCLPQEAPHS